MFLKRPRGSPKTCAWGGNCLFVFVYICNKKRAEPCVHAHCVKTFISKGKKARLDISQQTVQITFLTLLYHPEFASAGFVFSSNRVTFLLKSDRCGSNDAFSKRGLVVYRPASPKAPTLPEGSDRDDFNSSQPFNDG